MLTASNLPLRRSGFGSQLAFVRTRRRVEVGISFRRYVKLWRHMCCSMRNIVDSQVARGHPHMTSTMNCSLQGAQYLPRTLHLEVEVMLTQRPRTAALTDEPRRGSLGLGGPRLPRLHQFGPRSGVLLLEACQGSVDCGMPPTRLDWQDLLSRGGIEPATLRWPTTCLTKWLYMGSAMRGVHRGRIGCSGGGWAWIVRWLVSPRTIQGALKKASVQCSLTAGRVVLIQTAPIWEGTFPGTMVKSSAVVDASRDCPIGGFAILLSAR